MRQLSSQRVSLSCRTCSCSVIAVTVMLVAMSAFKAASVMSMSCAVVPTFQRSAAILATPSVRMAARVPRRANATRVYPSSWTARVSSRAPPHTSRAACSAPSVILNAKGAAQLGRTNACAAAMTSSIVSMETASPAVQPTGLPAYNRRQ